MGLQVSRTGHQGELWEEVATRVWMECLPVQNELPHVPADMIFLSQNQGQFPSFPGLVSR